AHPIVHPQLLDLGGDDVFRWRQGGEQALEPGVGELRELTRKFRREALRARRVIRSPYVQPLLADRHQADALAAAEILGEAAHAGDVLHDEAVRTVAHVAGRHLAESLAPHLRVDAICADDEVGTLEIMAGWSFSKRDGSRRQAAVEHIEQVRAMHQRALRELAALI